MARTLLDIAQNLGGKLRDGVSANQAGVAVSGSRIAYGYARSDSADNRVTVVLDGAYTPGDTWPDGTAKQEGDFWFEAACDSIVRNGDRIKYSSVGGRSMVVSLAGNTAAIEANALLAQQAKDNADDAAQAASDAAQAASDASDEAQAAMAAIDQHFWSDSDGVHVTEVTQDGWNDSSSSDYHRGKNILLNSLGVILRNALAYLAQFTASGVTFFDGSGTSADHQTAQFTSTTARVGMLSQKHVTMNSNGISIADGDYTQARFNGGSIAFYDGLGNNADNITAQFGKSGAVVGYQASDNVTIYPGGMEVNTNGLMSCEIAKSSDQLAGMVSRERFSYTSPGPLMYIFNGSPLSGSKVGFVYGGEIVIIFLQGRANTQTLSSDYGGITVAYDGNNQITVSGGSLTSAAVGVNYQMATAVDAPYFTFGTSTDEATDRAAISFTSGIGLTARHRFQSVLGKYNADYDGPLVVGNGTDAYYRSNAMTVGWDGTVTLGTPLPVASGGTGATGVSSATTGASVITVASGVTLQSATFRTWGKMAQVLIGVRVSSSLAANATVTIGTIVSGKRPVMATQCGYISNDGYISTDGSVVVRNITGASIGTSTTIYTAATYLLA